MWSQDFDAFCKGEYLLQHLFCNYLALIISCNINIIDTLVYNYRYVHCILYIIHIFVEVCLKHLLGVTSIGGPGLIEEFSPRSQRQIKVSEGENGNFSSGPGPPGPQLLCRRWSCLSWQLHYPCWQSCDGHSCYWMIVACRLGACHLMLGMFSQQQMLRNELSKLSDPACTIFFKTTRTNSSTWIGRNTGNPVDKTFTQSLWKVVFKAQRILVPGSKADGADSEYVGLWHVDGHRERVAAVVLYYYHVDPKLRGGDMEFCGREPMDILGIGDCSNNFEATCLQLNSSCSYRRDSHGFCLGAQDFGRDSLKVAFRDEKKVSNCRVPIRNSSKFRRDSRYVVFLWV